MAAPARVRPVGHWLDWPNTTYGVITGAELDAIDTDLYNLRTAALNLKDRAFGVTGDGVTNDTAAITAALTAAAGQTLLVPAGTYVFSSLLAVPANTAVQLLPGAHLLCKVTGGGNAITLADGAAFAGTGLGSSSGSSLTAHSTANVAALVTNAATDGTQEYAYVRGLYVTAQSSAVVSAGIKVKAVFVNSGVQDCVVACNSVITNGIVLTGSATSGYGPVYLRDCWVVSSAGDGVLVTEDAAHPGGAIAWLDNVTAEHPAAGFNCFKFAGFGGLSVKGRNLHTENSTVTASPSAAVYIDGVSDCRITNLDVFASNIANKSGVVITNNANNTFVVAENVTNPNLVTPVLNDQLNSVQYGAVHMPHYATTDVGIFRNQQQTLTYGASVATNVALGNYAMLVVSNGTAFTIANPTNMRTGEVVTYEITNASGGAMGAVTWGAAFAFRDTSYANPANGKRRTISFIYRGSNWAQVGAASGDM